MEQPPERGGMVIDHTALKAETLESLIEEYVTRYHGLNESENPLDEHKAFVTRALADGRLMVWFDGETQTASLCEASPSIRV